MKRLGILIVCIISCYMVVAQQSLKGNVVSSDTHKPIASANVFLSNTAIGSITNENGEFTILHFPNGRYDLVVSFIGYESYVISLQSNKLPANLEVVLKPKTNELKEVILEPFEKNGWEKWGSFFMENFIGTSAFAEECELRNKDIIKFRFSKKKNILQAFANDRLIVENKALGYVLKYDLVRFEYDFNTHLFIYQGYPLFEEMETKRNGLRKRWITNREDAYYGSMMHFMRSLYRNKLFEQHFEVRKLIKLPTEEKRRVQAAYAKTRVPILINERNVVIADDKKTTLDPDTLAYYRKVMQQPESFNLLINQLLPGDSIAYAIDSLGVQLEFSNYLQVIYTQKKAPEEYGKSLRKIINEPITSELFRLTDDAITVLANGSYFEGTNLISSGYWAWSEKVAALLPADYWPRPKTK